MNPTKYTYSIQNDFPDHKVAPDRLSQEIRDSSIVTAFDYVETVGDDCNIWFKDPLSLADKATLDGIVATHSGIPLPSGGLAVTEVLSDGSDIPRTGDGKAQVSIWPTEGDRVTTITPNWCDRTTWYHKAIRVVGEAPVWGGATWQLAHTSVIDTYHGKISQEDFLKDAGGFGYRVAVTVNAVAKVEQDPAFGVGGDFIVDYAAGTITFLDGTLPGDAVLVTYHYATTSEFILKPKAGKALKIRRVEVAFSDNVIINDTVSFQAYGLVEAFAPQLTPVPYPPGTMIPLGNPVLYKTLLDYINDSNGAFPKIPACGGPSWRGTQNDIVTLVWDYAAMTPLYSSAGMEIRIALQHDLPMGGKIATATFYCLSESDLAP